MIVARPEEIDTLLLSTVRILWMVKISLPRGASIYGVVSVWVESTSQLLRLVRTFTCCCNKVTISMTKKSWSWLSHWIYQALHHHSTGIRIVAIVTLNVTRYALHPPRSTMYPNAYFKRDWRAYYEVLRLSLIASQVACRASAEIKLRS
jgi:hypothetical protein